jgi:hypothetical protein
MDGIPLPSPFEGRPDGRILLPKKPVRLTLQPEQALALYATLEMFLARLDAEKSKPGSAALARVLLPLQESLFDRLEVEFDE